MSEVSVQTAVFSLKKSTEIINPVVQVVSLADGGEKQASVQTVVSWTDKGRLNVSTVVFSASNEIIEMFTREYDPLRLGIVYNDQNDQPLPG